MQKILLYYLFTPLADPEAVRLWQQSVCERYELTGRIILSPHGINGTVEGNLAALKTYVRQTKSYPAFRHMSFKWSDSMGNAFPKLSVKVRSEIVTFGVPDEVKVGSGGIVDGGKHLKPAQVHQLVAERGNDVVFFDGRNKHEAAIGKFKNAIVPEVNTTREFITELESGKYDALKHRPVVTYCTGGVRCEVLSSLMKHRGFQEVYQIDGGIVRYGETYGDKGLWEGALYVFDGRKDMTFSDQAKTISSCCFCGNPTSNYENCANADCNARMLQCSACQGMSLCPPCQATMVLATDDAA